MAVTFTPGDIVHIEHPVGDPGKVYDIGGPQTNRQATKVWRNGEPVGVGDFRRIDTSGDEIHLTTWSQKVRVKQSGESQPGMLVGNVVDAGPGS